MRLMLLILALGLVPGIVTHAGEHPRLLFNRGDLPELRRVAQTEQGQRILARLDALLAMDEHGFGYRPPPAPAYAQGYWAAGYGLQYQLTGDDRYADYAQRLVASCLYSPSAYGNQWGEPMFIAGVALAYDLWHDAWPDDFNQTVLLYLERNARQIATLAEGQDPLGLGDAHRFANDLPLDERGATRMHWAAQLRAAGALAALAIEGDAVTLREPIKPSDAPLIEPAKDYEPWVGVPIVTLTDNNMPGVWLLNGPFFRQPGDDDPLQAIGGRAHARPEPGDTLASQGVALPWRRYHPSGSGRPADPQQPLLVKTYPRECGIYWSYSNKYGGYAPAQTIHRTDKRDDLFIYLYTVLRVEQPRVVQALPNRGSLGFGTRMWLQGHELRDGDLARLTPGLYPLMVEQRVTGGYANQAPRFAIYTDADYATDRARYTQAQRLHVANGGAMPGVDQHLGTLRAALRDYFVTAFGDTGLADHAGQGDFAAAASTVIPYLLAERHAGHAPAADTGFAQLTAAAYQLPGTPGRDYRFAATLAPQLMAAAHRPAAAALINRDGRPMHHAHQALLALLALRDAPPAESADISIPFALAAHHDGVGRHSFASSFEPRAAWLATLEHGRGQPGNLSRGGQVALHGPRGEERSVWLADLGHAGHAGDRFATNTPTAPGLELAEPPHVLHETLEPDGGGHVALRWRAGHATWQRAVRIDYSVDQRIVTLALGDELRGLHGQPLRWQLMTGLPFDTVTLDAKANTWVATLPDTAVMTVKLLHDHATPPRLETITHANGRLAGLRAHFNEPTEPAELDAWRRLQSGIDELVRESRGESSEADDLLAELTDQFAAAERTAANTQADQQQTPTRVFALITIAPRAGPIEAVASGDGALSAAVAGRVWSFDGQRIDLAAPK